MLRYLNVFLGREAESPDDSPAATGQRCSGSLKPTWESAQHPAPGGPAPSSRASSSLPERQTRTWTLSRRRPRYTRPTLDPTKVQAPAREGTGRTERSFASGSLGWLEVKRLAEVGGRQGPV